ncbi:MAG: Sec-independent protein translocase subunit TatA/TatB [Thermomicrobiales bacterium]|nr:twin-arginine translocase TatA/TatE family subunit [Thermomicrobiales bacterium]
MSFFGLGPVELLLIAVVAGLIFGVGRMPEIAGALGKSMREFKTSVNDAPPAPPTSPATAPHEDVELRREEV